MHFKDRNFQTLLAVTIGICTIGRTDTLYGICENQSVGLGCSHTCSGIRQYHRRELETKALDLRIEGVEIPGFKYLLVVLAVHYVCYVRESTSSSLLFLPLSDLPGKVRGALYVLPTFPFLLLVYPVCFFLPRHSHHRVRTTQRANDSLVAVGSHGSPFLLQGIT